MPKVFLTYKLPEDSDALKRAQCGADYYDVLWDLDNELRSCIKHGTSKVASKHAQVWRNRLYDLLKENDISL